MKKNILRTLSTLLVMAIIFSFAGCKKSGGEDSSSDLGTTSGIISSDGDTDGTGNQSEDSTSSDASGNNSSAAQTSGNTSTAGKPVNATTSKTTNFSWKEVKATIPSSLNGTTVTVYSWNEVTDVTGAKDVISKFTKETGIKINWKVGSYTNYVTEIASKVASKNAPDIVRLKDYNLGLLSLLMPLSETGYNFNDSAWDKSVMNFYSYNGKSYAANMQNTLLQQPKCLIYNRNLVSKYDLEDPYSLWKKSKWNWTKFVEVCKDFKEQADSSSLAWTSYTWADCADLLGAGFTKFDGKTFTSNMNSADLLKGWQMMAEVEEAGLSNNIRFDRTNFENGKILFFTESPIGARRTHYYFSTLKSTGALAAVPMPVVDGYKELQMYGEYEAYGIPAGAKNALAACYFLRYYLDAANYDESTFFADKTILEVYKSLRANTNVYCNYDHCIVTEDIGTAAIHLNAQLVNKPKAQIKSKLDEIAPQVDAAVKAANSKLSSIK